MLSISDTSAQYILFLKKNLKRISLLLLVLSFSAMAQAADCTFNGNGDGTSWSDPNNWNCGHVPDPSSEDIIVPGGFDVVYDLNVPLVLDGGNELKILGSIDMKDQSILLTHEDSELTVGGNGSLFNVDKLSFSSGATGSFGNNTNTDVDSLNITGTSEVNIKSDDFIVSISLTNENTGAVTGNGCITYLGTQADFTNSSTGGIFGCTSTIVTDCVFCNLILSVKYQSIDVVLHEDGVEISWITKSEKNSDFFTIQRSYDGLHWEDIYTLEAAGSSDAEQYYMHVDTDPFIGLNYYRIIETETNGKTNKSAIKQITISSKDTFKMTVFPNPVHVGEPVHVHFEGTFPGHLLHLTIFDNKGRLVQTDVVETDEYHGVHIGVDVDHKLKPGTYVIKAINGSNSTNHKLIVQ